MLDQVNGMLVGWFGNIAPEWRTVLSIMGVGLALCGYAWTIYKTYTGKSAPNPISWFGFAFLTAVGALVQHKMGAGVGAWTMDLTAVCCGFQGLASLLWKRGGWHWNDFKFWSWASLALGIICFVAFMGSKVIGLTPLGAAVFATLSDLFLYGPAIVHSWKDPWSENAGGYFWQSVKNAPAIAALAIITPASWLYPMMLLWVNGFSIIYFLSRRKFVTANRAKLNES